MSDNTDTNNGERKLVLSRMQCTNCLDIMISHHRHDYVTCKCGKCTLDGGREYQKFTVSTGNTIIDTSVYSDAPFEILRDAIHRGGRGPSGEDEITWVPLSKINDKWLQALIPYNVKKGYAFSFDTIMYMKEVTYREEHRITVLPDGTQKTLPDIIDDHDFLTMNIELPNGEKATLDVSGIPNGANYNITVKT